MQFGTDIFVKLLVVGEVGYGSIGRGGTKLFTQPNGGGKGEVEKGKKYAGTKEPTHDLQMRKEGKWQMKTKSRKLKERRGSKSGF